MKKKGLNFHYSTLYNFCQERIRVLVRRAVILTVLMGSFGIFRGFGFFDGFFVGKVSASDTKNVNNFYFKSFDADYYLTQDYDGVSKMRVVENLTAVFPVYEQNKGICRQIPIANNDGLNVVLPFLYGSDIKVLRNGEEEPIYSLDKKGDHYEVCTGTDDYLLGTQKYTLEYEFEKVVMDFSGFQEIYWDTNGNDWEQEFFSLTARVHFSEEILDSLTKETQCYVGKIRGKGSERCFIEEIDDGFSFSTENLRAGENLTFVMDIKAGTFVVPEPEKNYVLIWFLGGLIVICGLILAFSFKRYLKSREKVKHYKEYFVKPEYQPHSKYSLAEMAENYLGKKKDFKTGLLLQMIIEGKVVLKKKESKIFEDEEDWVIIVKKIDEARIEELALLAILNAGNEVEEGDKINVNSNEVAIYTRTTALADKIEKTVLADLKEDKLVEKEYKIKERGTIGGLIFGIATIVFVLSSIIAPILMTVIETAIKDLEDSVFGKVVGKEIFWLAVVLIIGITVIVKILINKKVKNIEKRTMLGLEMSRYMDGLKMYIEMAEADRLKLLQSVSGVETTPEGIVKLNEKLLPYAAVFGLETSWAEELEEYYNLHEMEIPDWCGGDFSIGDAVSASWSATTYADLSFSSSSGGGDGSFSSSSSGSDGGGFSGGGGGGGGGGGR